MNDERMDFELTDLHESSQRVLNGLQQQFAEYQQSSFVQRSPEFFCLELCGEAGELANIEKKRWKGKVIPEESFSDEAADIFIALMNYVQARGIRLGDAVRSKLIHIEERRRAMAERGESY